MFLSASPLRRNRWTEKSGDCQGFKGGDFRPKGENTTRPLTVTKTERQKTKNFRLRKGGLGASPILYCPLDGGDIEDIRGNKPKK